MTLVLTPEQQQELWNKLQSKELDANSPEIKQAIVTRFRDEPLNFATNLLKEHCKDQSTGLILPTPHFHKEMMMLYLNHRFVGLAAPRNHAKSTVTTLFYILYAALYGLKTNIVIISSTEDMAARFLRRIRDELESNKLLIWLFGDQRTDKWSEHELRLANGAVLHAKGQGAQIRGLIEGPKRPDLIVLDDIEDDEGVRSQLRRLDLEGWFNASVLPTIEPKTGQIIIVGTILHEDSLLNRIVAKGLYPDFETKRFAALMDNDEPLWPERFSKEYLQSVKDAYIVRDQLHKFYMEYMNDPIPQEAAEFKMEYFTFFDQKDIPKTLSIEIFVDLGGGSVKTGADDTAMVVVGTDEQNTMYVLDYISDKMGTDVERIAHDLFTLVDRWNPHRVSIEKTQAANFFMVPLSTAMAKERKLFSVNYFNPPRGASGGDRRGNMSDAKYERIAALASKFKFQTIKIQRWQTKLIEQLIAFPRAKHDDIADALAYAYMFGNKRLSQLTKQEEEEVADSGYQPLYEDIGL